MRSTGNRTAALVLTLVALAVALVPVVQPLAGGQITCGYDDAFHLYRAVQISRLWDDSVLFSRWAPDMALGFGFPLFIFASPFPPSLVALIHRLGAGWPAALNAVFVLGIVIGAAGMLWLAATLVGPRRGAALGGGLVAAVAYAYAPFQAYDVYNRGSLWEAFAWAWPPLVLLGVQRWSVERDRRFLLLGVGAFAAMVLSHHLFAFLFAPVFGLWVIANAAAQRRWAGAQGRWAVVWRGALLGLLGLGLTAFFWLPAMFERPLVQTERLLGTWVFDYRYNFLSLEHMLALPRRADPALLNDWPQKALGLVPVVLALLPLVAWRRLARTRRWQVGALWVALTITALLTLSASQPIWDTVPLLGFVQFPWRYLGPAAFCVALLIGLGAGALIRGREGDVTSCHAEMTEDLPATPLEGLPAILTTGLPAVLTAGLPAILTAGLPAVLTAGLMLANVGWLYPDHCAAPSHLTVAGMIRWERLTDTLGTTAKGEYLPIWVQKFPDVSLDEAYATGEPVARLSASDLPEGASIVGAQYGAQDAEIRLNTPVAFHARYLAFYYPGWHVTVDGGPVAATPEAGSGLLSFQVPAGEHTVNVWFGETPDRWGGDGLSVLSVVALAALLVPRMRGSRDRRRSLGSPRRVETGVSGKPQRSVSQVASGSVLIAVAAVVAVKVGVVDRLEIAWRATRLTSDGTLSGVAAPADVDFGHRAMLLGMESLPDAVRADESPVLTLYWRALDPGAAEWHVGLTLIAPDGSRWAAGLRPARWARTPPPISEWAQDAYARMDYDVDLPSGLAPGRFTVVLSLFDRATAVPASVLGADGNPVGPELTIGEIEVLPPAEAPTAAALGADSEVAACGPLRLLDAEVEPVRAAPGDLLTVSTAWEAASSPEEDLALAFTATDGAGAQLKQWRDLAPVGWWPTSRWMAGDRWVGRTTLRLPGSLNSGEITLAMAAGNCRLATWALQVEAPERVWTVPDGFTALDEVLGGQVRLAGYRLSAGQVTAGGRLEVALAWQATAEMETAYRVFVHVAGPDGTLLAQDDGEPVGWTRPTTGWAVGEVVVDPRTVTIPDGAADGTYEVRVGLYDADGVRLATTSGADAIVLGEVIVR